MSISDEISALRTNLSSAKRAVNNKGGVAGNTGLAGLANEISNIPADFGSVSFLDSGNNLKTVFIKSQEEFESLGGANSSRNIRIGGYTFKVYKIVSVEAGSAVQTIPRNFLRGATALTSFSFGVSRPTSIQPFFLYECASFNEDLYIPSSVTSIGMYFLSYCSLMISTVHLGNLSSSIIESSEYSFIAIDSQPAVKNGIRLEGTYVDDWLTKFPNGQSRFLYKDIDVPENSLIKYDGVAIQLTASDMPSLGTTSSYITINGVDIDKQEIYGVNLQSLSVSNIPDNFLTNCKRLRKLALPLSDEITNIGSSFLRGCESFNAPITAPNAVVTGSDFMYHCYAFNSDLIIKGISSSAERFLFGAQAFNKPLNLLFTDNIIPNNLLFGCINYNQPIIIPSYVTSIGSGVLFGCRSFNQPIRVPNTLTSIGQGFLGGLRDMTSKVYCDAPTTIFDQDTSQYLTSGTSDDPAYVTGITLVGSYASEWKEALPDSTELNKYRKLILGNL